MTDTAHRFANDADRRACEQLFSDAVRRGELVDDKHHAEAFISLYLANRHLITSGKADMVVGLAHTLGDIRRADTGATRPGARTASAARPVAFEHVVDDNVPADLDKEASALHDRVIAHMRGSRFDYFTALADLTRMHDLADLSDAPPRAAFEEAVADVTQRIAENPALAGELAGEADVYREQLAEHMRAALTLRREGVSYFAAREIMEMEDRIAALEAEHAELDASPVPWRNTSALPEPPRPWSDEDWERDRRRLAAGGVDEEAMPRELWESAATEGTDVARELIAAAREHELGAARGRLEEARRDGRAREAERRRGALNDVLERRARERLAQARERTMRHV